MPEAPARRDETERLAAEPRPAPRSRVAAPPARRPAPRSSAAPALPGLLHRAGAVLRHPAGVVGTLLGIGAVAAVATNALTFQSGRHPAPLFAKAPPAAGKSASAQSASDRPAPGRTPPAAPSREAAAATGETARAAKPAPDGIGDLIRGDTHTTAALPSREPAGRPGPARPDAARAADKGSERGPDRAAARPSAAPAAEVRALAARTATPAKADPAAALRPGSVATGPDKDVAFAQRALVKLGYGPLAVDGVIGPGTRAALDRFERDRRLTGVSRGTLRELAARFWAGPGVIEAGIRIAKRSAGFRMDVRSAARRRAAWFHPGHRGRGADRRRGRSSPAPSVRPGSRDRTRRPG